MGMLEDLMKQAGGVAEIAQKNPQAVAAILALLNSRDTSVGGNAAASAACLAQFQQAGLGDMMSSWISTGPNPPISAAAGRRSVLGGDVLAQFAKPRPGVSHGTGRFRPGLPPARGRRPAHPRGPGPPAAEPRRHPGLAPRHAGEVRRLRALRAP